MEGVEQGIRGTESRESHAPARVLYTSLSRAPAAGSSLSCQDLAAVYSSRRWGSDCSTKWLFAIHRQHVDLIIADIHVKVLQQLQHLLRSEQLMLSCCKVQSLEGHNYFLAADSPGETLCGVRFLQEADASLLHFNNDSHMFPRALWHPIRNCTAKTIRDY